MRAHCVIVVIVIINCISHPVKSSQFWLCKYVGYTRKQTLTTCEKMWLLYTDRTQIVYIYHDLCSLYFSTHFNLTNILQVTWLVVTEVLSQSFGLVTERRHDNARHIFHRRVWYRALSLSCAFIRSSGIILTPGYLCTKFRFCIYLRCWASPQRKIAYPSPMQSINQSPSFFYATGTEAFASKNTLKIRQKYNSETH